ncbi:MAG: hypothetical protein PHQ27_04295 [Victivallales bacterium]|nr:hypothetical protein [Victivallales bacterium]
MSISYRSNPFGIDHTDPRYEWRFWTEGGEINISFLHGTVTYNGTPGVQWKLPGQSPKIAIAVNETIPAGWVEVNCDDFHGRPGTYSYLSISLCDAMQNAVLWADKMPRVKYYYYSVTLNQLRGNIADMPRASTYVYLINAPLLRGVLQDMPQATNNVYLQNLPLINGNTSDLARELTGNLFLSSLSTLTGDVANIGINSGTTRQVFNCNQITGALNVHHDNTLVFYYGNDAVTPAEYDQTVANVVAAGGANGSMRISSRRTSASDADIAALIDRGWTIDDSYR